MLSLFWAVLLLSHLPDTITWWQWSHCWYIFFLWCPFDSASSHRFRSRSQISLASVFERMLFVFDSWHLHSQPISINTLETCLEFGLAKDRQVLCGFPWFSFEFRLSKKSSQFMNHLESGQTMLSYIATRLFIDWLHNNNRLKFHFHSLSYMPTASPCCYSMLWSHWLG